MSAVPVETRRAWVANKRFDRVTGGRTLSYDEREILRRLLVHDGLGEKPRKDDVERNRRRFYDQE